MCMHFIGATALENRHWVHAIFKAKLSLKVGLNDKTMWSVHFGVVVVELINNLQIIIVNSK